MTSNLPLVDAEVVYLTADGWRRLTDELTTLRDQRHAGVDEDALSPDDQAELGVRTAQLDFRIAELERVLRRAVVAHGVTGDPETVGVGSWVRVRWQDGETDAYQVVGPLEAAPRESRISYECPVGRALIGRRAGDAIEVPGAGGPSRLEILAIEASQQRAQGLSHATPSAG